MFKNSKLKIVVIALLSVSCAAALVGCAAGRLPETQAEADHRQSAWRAAGYPSKHHKALEPLAGVWDVEISAWTAPNRPPDKFFGKTARHWVLGDRFLEETFTGELWKENLTAQGLLGYDRTDKQYVATWVDTFSTAIRYQHGSFDPQKRELVLKGKYTDPDTGAMRDTESVTRILGPDLHVVEAWEIDPDGSRRKTTEFVFTRR